MLGVLTSDLANNSSVDPSLRAGAQQDLASSKARYDAMMHAIEEGRKSAPGQGIVDALTFGQGGPAFDKSRTEMADNAGIMARQAAATVPGGGGGVGGGGMYSVTAAGSFGSSNLINMRDPGGYSDPNAIANKAALLTRIRDMGNVSPSMSQGSHIDQSQQAQFRQQQLALGNALMAQANGQGPSLAGSQLQQSTDQNLQAALAQAASARGGNLGAAQYQLGNARANIQQQAAQQLAQTRIQEQMAARQQLGDLLNQGRGADIGLAATQAQLSQQNNQFNAGQSQQMEQFRQHTLNQLLAMGMSYDQASAQADLQARQFAAGLFNQGQLGAQGISTANNAQTMQLIGGGIGAAGSLLATGAQMGMNSGGGGGGYAGSGQTANGAMGPMTITGINGYGGSK